MQTVMSFPALTLATARATMHRDTRLEVEGGPPGTLLARVSNSRTRFQFDRRASEFVKLS